MVRKVSDETFFALCEYHLADPQTSARYHRSFAEKGIFLLVRYLGVIGMLLAYCVLVLRHSAVSLTCFRQAAVLDIHGKLILCREEIGAESCAVPIRRRHVPSRQIIGEIRAAHRRYTGLRRSSEGDAPIPTRAASNEMYLVWLLHFYVHRSIILANADMIRSTIGSVVTLEEFTPLIAGYLSAFADLKVPLVLYLPVKLSEPKLTLQAVPLFTRVVVTNGGTADFLHANGREDVLLEEAGCSSGRTARPADGAVAAVFLASYYTLDDAELARFLSRSTIPYLQRFQETWRPLKVRIHCHPNDARPRPTLERTGFDVAGAESRTAERMADLAIVLSGNTSVIDEALAAGIPVIYCGTLDRYSYDLMGYVKEGLVLDGTHECPTPAMAQGFFQQPQTRAKLDGYRRGSGSHRSVRLADAIQAATPPRAGVQREAMHYCD